MIRRVVLDQAKRKHYLTSMTVPELVTVVLIEPDGMARPAVVEKSAAEGAGYILERVRIYPRKDDPWYHIQKRAYKRGRRSGPYFWFDHVES